MYSRTQPACREDDGLPVSYSSAAQLAQMRPLVLHEAQGPTGDDTPDPYARCLDVLDGHARHAFW